MYVQLSIDALHSDFDDCDVLLDVGVHVHRPVPFWLVTGLWQRQVDWFAWGSRDREFAGQVFTSSPEAVPGSSMLPGDDFRKPWVTKFPLPKKRDFKNPLPKGNGFSVTQIR